MGADFEHARPSTYAFPDSLLVGELRLRAPDDADIDVIAPAFRDPAVGGEAGLPPLDTPLLRSMQHGQLVEFRERGLLAPFVIEDTDDGAIVGGANLRRFDPTMRDPVELGYWLFVEARGRGIATRVVKGLVDDSHARGINRVEAHVRVGNTASERVLQRAGFEREGVKRRLLRHGGGRVDATLFAHLE
jgi:RimJ/RimL family protein N-acetyltransferase